MFPRKIIDRDPRNHAHFVAAAKLCQQLSEENHISSQTAAEAAAFVEKFQREHGGKIKVTDEPVADAIGVGTFFFLEQGLMTRDNVISKCADCGNVLQVRPHFVALILCCVFCAADRMLSEYWKEKGRFQ